MKTVSNLSTVLAQAGVLILKETLGTIHLKPSLRQYKQE